MSAKQAQAKPLLEVQNLTVSFAGRDAATVAVRGLSYSLNPAETLAIVGESGSGKTQSVMSLIGLLPENGRVAGTANFAGRNLLALSSAELNSLRGKDIAMIFQDPMTALNPYLTIGRQMALVVNRHLHQAGATAAAVCLNMLDAVRIPEPKQRLSQYPHELSGGMRQRVMIATALLCQPKLLIADEPTTALDVTVQAQILELLRELQAEFSTAMLLITHDMGVVAGNCERVLVMAHGECVETGAVNAIFHQPQHAYTRSLLAAVPRLDAANTTLNIPANTAPCLSVKDLEVTYELESHAILRAPEKLKALRGVSFELLPGETLGVVGESGCGKSTLARGVLQLIRPSHGNVVLLGESLHKLSARQLRAKRSDMQIIFQEP